MSVFVCHLVYQLVKRAAKRHRPCEIGVAQLGRTLDRYSFPSGHCMTLCAALSPFWINVDGGVTMLVATIIPLAWARVLSGHHYPSDTVAGAAIGCALSLAVWWSLA